LLLLFELLKPFLKVTPTPVPLPPTAGVSILSILLIIFCIIGFLLYWLPSFIAFGSRPRKRNSACISL
jgi:hypothetical protein